MPRSKSTTGSTSRADRKRSRKIPRTPAGRFGVLVAVLALAVCGAQLGLQIHDHWFKKRPELFIELKPSTLTQSVAYSRDPFSNALIFEFPFDGRVVNEGEAAISLESWNTVGTASPDDESQAAAFAGSSGLINSTVSASPTSGGSNEISLPLLLASGAEISFLLWLRVEVPQEYLSGVLADLVDNTNAGRLQMSTAIEGWPESTPPSTIFADAAIGSLSRAATPAGIRVCFTIRASEGLRYGYSFLWVLPDRIQDAQETEGAACREES